ncbi:hypothetical protein D6817_01595 [Candidatus Pacearchaeota archaeon]|nr:MAG: hypothetical protein D6817_01595 [Candidatus Pacearchaeota archaeon]
MPSSCRRATSDIDLAVVEPLSYSRFNRFASPIADWLQAHGYSARFEKAHATNRLVYGAEGETMVIEFPRKSERNFAKKAKNLEREFEHSRKKLVEERGATYRVVSPEDIAAPKLARCTTYLELDDSLCRYIEGVKPSPLSDAEVRCMLDEIEYLRARADLFPDDKLLATKTRFLSDIFDVRLLSESAGFNERYFERAIRSWDNIVKHPASARLLLNYLLPATRVDVLEGNSLVTHDTKSA